MSEIREIWNAGAHLYDEAYATNIPYHRSHEMMVDLLCRSGVRDVLDLGAGTGVLAERILSAIPDCRVTCLDVSEAMLAGAARRLEPFGARAELVRADMETWSPTREFDAVVTCNALAYEGVPMEERYRRIAVMLRPGGLLLHSVMVSWSVPPFLGRLAQNLVRPEEQPVNPDLIAFARGPGRRITFCGEGSLIRIYALEEHLRFVRAAGLEGACVWRYLTQAVVAGYRPEAADPA